MGGRNRLLAPVVSPRSCAQAMGIVGTISPFGLTKEAPASAQKASARDHGNKDAHSALNIPCRQRRRRQPLECVPPFVYHVWWGLDGSQVERDGVRGGSPTSYIDLKARDEPRGLALGQGRKNLWNHYHDTQPQASTDPNPTRQNNKKEPECICRY